MNNLWQRISLGRDFTVISVTGDRVCGGRFVRHGKTWRMTVHAVGVPTPEAPEETWRDVARRLGGADYCAVTGRLDGALFCRFPSANLSYAAQRGAVELELPRRLIRMPDQARTQFAADPTEGPDGSVGVNVAALPGAGVKALVAVMEAAGIRADEFIYPFLAADPQLPEILLPEVEPDFYFASGNWIPVPSDPAEVAAITGKMLDAVRKIIVLPDDPEFVPADFLPLLMTATLIAKGTVHRCPEAFKVLPERVRPVRYRQHIIVSALLLAALAAGLVWYFFRTYGADIREFRKLTREVRVLKKETASMKSSAKRNSKELKEMSRVVDMNVGKFDAVLELGLLSEILPANVMVSSLRWSDSDIDMVLQCENDKLDVPALIQPLRRWRVAQLQQRQGGDSAVATMNLKLSPPERSEKGRKEARR